MPQSQRELARAVLKKNGIARLLELRRAGVTAATVSRMERDGQVLRLLRGIYQLAGAEVDAQHSLAETAKRLPRAVICLTSALAFHGLTDRLPKRTWVAIGAKDWAPKTDLARLRIVRFTPRLLAEDVETHMIEKVPVRVFSVAKTVADCFRHRRAVGLDVAIEGLREALRQRKATAGEIARKAERGGVSTVLRPYLEALTANA